MLFRVFHDTLNFKSTRQFYKMLQVFESCSHGYRVIKQTNVITHKVQEIKKQLKNKPD